MAYRNSLLSLYPSPSATSTPTNLAKTDLTSQFEEELPATSPVFEGHLYLRTDKKQWQWRLFRFDGTSFTCLSTRKVKLPPNTHVDAPLNDRLLLQSLPSFTNTSLTSPLLATPKNKSRQTSTASTTSPLASYYQLPKWTVDIVNISAVSILKPSSSHNGSRKKKLPVISQKQSRCFCVRTFDGNCYIMKAHKQKDLERWLFVLTKMWKFALAMKLQLASQQPQHQQILRQQQHQQQPYPQPSSILSTQSQQILQSQDAIPLSRMYQRPQHTSLEESNIAAHSLSMVKTQTQMASGLSSRPISPTPASTSHLPTKSSIHYVKRYQNPMLSMEKSECIDAWRQSLCELMASDPQLQVSIPPPIESIPDDDQVSIISDMTSISHRKPTLRRRASIASTASKRSSRSSKMKSRTNVATPRLKKKRSNDVKNWIEPRKNDNINTIAPHMSSLTPLAPEGSSAVAAAAANSTTIPQSHVAPTDLYHVDYFQDCKTTAGSTLMTFLELDSSDDPNVDQSDHPNKSTASNTVAGNRYVKYHNSARGKQIQVSNATSHHHLIPDMTATAPSSGQSHQQQLSSNDLSPVYRSLGDSDNNSTKHVPSSLMTPSPLYSSTHVDARQQPDDEEEISLADLQRSLKRTSLQQISGGVATLSSSSPFTVPALYGQPAYSSHHHNQYHQHQHYVPSATSGISITALAIPPIPCDNNLDRPALLSHPFNNTQTRRSGISNNGGSNDFYRQPNRKWKRQPAQQQKQHKQQDQRRNSWVSSCEQQNMVPLRQNMVPYP